MAHLTLNGPFYLIFVTVTMRLFLAITRYFEYIVIYHARNIIAAKHQVSHCLLVEKIKNSEYDDTSFLKM